MNDLQQTFYAKVFEYFYKLAWLRFNRKLRWTNDVMLCIAVTQDDDSVYDTVTFNYEAMLHGATTGHIIDNQFACIDKPIERLVDDFSDVSTELKSFYEKQLIDYRKRSDISNEVMVRCKWAYKTVDILTELNHSTLRQIGNITRKCRIEKVLWFANKLTMLAYILILIMLDIVMLLAITMPYPGLTMVMIAANMLFTVNTIITFYAIISLHKKSIAKIPDKLKLNEIEWPMYIKFLY